MHVPLFWWHVDWRVRGVGVRWYLHGCLDKRSVESAWAVGEEQPSNVTVQYACRTLLSESVLHCALARWLFPRSSPFSGLSAPHITPQLVGSIASLVLPRGFERTIYKPSTLSVADHDVHSAHGARFWSAHTSTNIRVVTG